MGALLDGMEGTEFDRDAVFAELREIDAIHAGYQVWVDDAAKMIGTMKRKMEAAEDRLAKQVGRARMQEGGEPAAAGKRTDEETEKLDKLRASLKAARDEGKRQEACAATLGDELSRTQAELARLEKERNAAVTRARSRAGEFEEMRAKLEQLQANQRKIERGAAKAKAEAERLQQRTKKMRARNEQLRARLQKAERWSILAPSRLLTRIRLSARPEETSR